MDRLKQKQAEQAEAAVLERQRELQRGALLSEAQQLRAMRKRLKAASQAAFELFVRAQTRRREADEALQARLFCLF